MPYSISDLPINRNIFYCKEKVQRKNFAIEMNTKTQDFPSRDACDIKRRNTFLRALDDKRKKNHHHLAK